MFLRLHNIADGMQDQSVKFLQRVYGAYTIIAVKVVEEESHVIYLNNEKESNETRTL